MTPRTQAEADAALVKQLQQMNRDGSRLPDPDSPLGSAMFRAFERVQRRSLGMSVTKGQRRQGNRLTRDGGRGLKPIDMSGGASTMADYERARVALAHPFAEEVMVKAQKKAQKKGRRVKAKDLDQAMAKLLAERGQPNQVTTPRPVTQLIKPHPLTSDGFFGQ